MVGEWAPADPSSRAPSGHPPAGQAPPGQAPPGQAPPGQAPATQEPADERPHPTIELPTADWTDPRQLAHPTVELPLAPPGVSAAEPRVPDAPATPGGELRVSDLERDVAIRLLRQGVGEGRIDLHEFEERLASALRARTYRELAAVTADLPSAPVEPAEVPDPRARTSDTLVLRRAGANIRRRGNWVVPRRIVVNNHAGSVRLNFAAADIRSMEVEIVLDVRAGTTTLILPRYATADIDEVAVGFGSLRCWVPRQPVPGRVHFRIVGRQLEGSLRIRHEIWTWFVP